MDWSQTGFISLRRHRHPSQTVQYGCGQCYISAKRPGYLHLISMPWTTQTLVLIEAKPSSLNDLLLLLAPPYFLILRRAWLTYVFCCCFIGRQKTYRISSYSFRGNYSFLNLEIVANSNSCRNISIFWKTIQERNVFKCGNYMRTQDIFFSCPLWEPTQKH